MNKKSVILLIIVIILGLLAFFAMIRFQGEQANVSNVNGTNGAFENLRNKMVEKQIEKRGIKDEKVLEAMRKVERHKFVPENLISHAYDDDPLPIGYGQTISQPYIVALMTEKLNLKEGDKVLEIGTGSGYQAAILGEIINEVYTIEIVDELATQAEERLKNLGYEKIKVKSGDGYYGWEEYAPFDKIIITAAANHLPSPLIEQLKNGGQIILPLRNVFNFQNLILVTKKDGEIETDHITSVVFVPMTGKIQEE